MKIWRYKLDPGTTMLEMPVGAKVLSAQTRTSVRGTLADEVHLWAQVDPDEPKSRRWFVTIMTGEEFEPFSGEYVSTVQLYDGSIIAHVFEVSP